MTKKTPELNILAKTMYSQGFFVASENPIIVQHDLHLKDSYVSYRETQPLNIAKGYYEI